MAPAASSLSISTAHFPRSNSSPEFQLSFTSRPPLPPNSPALNKELPRLPSFESFEIPSFDAIHDLDAKLSLPGTPPSLTLDSSPVITPATSTSIKASTSTSTSAISNLEPEQPANRFRRGLSRSRSTSRPKSWLPSFRPNKEDNAQPAQYLEPPLAKDAAMARHPSLKERSQSATDTFANFARRSWISRTPSPKITGPPPTDNASSDKTPKAAPKGTLRKSQPPVQANPPELTARSEDEVDAQKPATLSSSRTGAFFFKPKPKLSTLVTVVQDWGADSDSCASSAASLSQTGPQSVASRTSQSTSSERSNATPITDDSSNEMTPQVRDSLWSSFKTLELEFKSFTLKQMTQRIAQIQTVLLPFLRSTMHHPSTKKLQPEDIDRRAVILNKWWNVILDMLDSQANQPIPGVDRPILLEAATMVMMRPEWRRATPAFQPLVDRCPTDKVRSRSWTSSSFDSQNSMLLDETAEHSVRTMFVGNLIRQMSLVVEKMSLRHAPLTLVNFAGKTCAYAFFFAPGVADILMRLWGLTPELIRRAADEFGLPRCDNGDGEDMAALFPPKLSPYAWTTPRAAWNYLKQVPKMSVLVARIPWTGPWVSRWKGRDTDLFFIFCKYFHVLTDQFLLPDLPLAFKARAPGFVFVQAQLLSMIDSTIHRQAALGQAAYPPPLVDSFHGADASAMAMPLPPSNLMKGMAENRLVALLKDILLDDFPDFASAKATFAETFTALLKAATQRTSKFNSSACFTLCDFLEEVLVIYDQYEARENVASCIDWTFWIEVFKRVMSSMNTMSEVRALSFLYTIWNVAAKQPSRKAELCFDWLLTEETFNSFFNNWCPMVRAYYHRLLCWRICRYDGSPSDVDIAVFRLAAKRLGSVWSHYLFLRETADETGRARPSSNPMSPTVGKRFIIIRQEVHAPQPGLVMGLDTFARTPSGTDLAAMSDYFDSSQHAQGDPKKRWSLFGKVLSFTNVASAADTPNPAGLLKSHSSDGLQPGGRDTASTRSRPSTQSYTQSRKMFQIGGSSATSDTESRCSTPLTDEPGFIFKFILAWQQQNGPSRERVLTLPQLPGPAQYRLNGPVCAKRPVPLDALRQVSSSSQPGLIDRAKNATPLSSPLEESTRRLSLAEPLQAIDSPATRTGVSSPSEESDATRTATPNTGYFVPEEARPSKPAGAFVRNAVYSGQALAEWTQVVNECNSFVDRRTDEGVDRLRDMEVPLLNVEGFRKLGG
ncbi:protein family UPF0592 [Cordyceps fumosorosea ARSEF 2679]|uniref:Protein family UPF0592 n=1 Tax=Cordyceps fumosorosea (strain ARSEF 2679) TaxID=1081104 RepID=A0A167XFU3_CORFA|nr:protein family UPF0592 [Cordyceps fumosorosea ARSEF 2679]OAA64928.1 protein family UPF0592 [Cordyceps fumosorosea ARSEF 2679]